jgi:DNA replication and repair protein RecF
MESVLLQRLTINNFRNLTQEVLLPGPRFNVIFGNNGAGKTNILEAIYFFSTLRSFRTVIRKELISSGCSEASLSGVFGGAVRHVCLDLLISDINRRVLRDQKELKDIGAHFAELPMVLFHPADVVLIHGGPKERRRFMDRALFQADPSYPGCMLDYNRALQNRNLMLKEKPNNIESLLPYDLQLARLGSRIVHSRRLFIHSVSPFFDEAAYRIGKGISASLTYKPDIEGDEKQFLTIFSSSFHRDRDRGFTSRGPHSDDIDIHVQQLSARRFASQGQQRMAVLSLKIAEAKALSISCGRFPIMLLDDISSELDRERNRELFLFLQQSGGQVFITTTHVDHVLLETDRLDFSISGGSLKKSSSDL